MTAPEGTVREQWTYTGTRVGHRDSRASVWLDAEGKERWFSTRDAAVIGGLYFVAVLHKDGGGVTRVGKPEYAGSRDQDVAQVAAWEALTALAERELTIAAAERRHKKNPELDRALARLEGLAGRMTWAQRMAFADYVADRLKTARRP